MASLVDKILLVLAWILLGSMKRCVLERYEMGPLELKSVRVKTPCRALSNIRSSNNKVVPGIGRFTFGGQVELVDGKTLDVDSIILATGYRSSWLKESEFFSKNGYPKMEFPNGWKGNTGLYTVGFTKRGRSRTSSDATRIATDIWKVWKEETTFACHRRCISQF